MNCKECNTQNEEGAVICSKCGNKIEKDNNLQISEVDSQEVEISTSISDEKPKNNKNKLIFSLVLVFIIALSVSVVLAIFEKEQSPAEKVYNSFFTYQEDRIDYDMEISIPKFELGMDIDSIETLLQNTKLDLNIKKDNRADKKQIGLDIVIDDKSLAELVMFYDGEKIIIESSELYNGQLYVTLDKLHTTTDALSDYDILSWIEKLDIQKYEEVIIDYLSEVIEEVSIDGSYQKVTLEMDKEFLMKSATELITLIKDDVDELYDYIDEMENLIEEINGMPFDIDYKIIVDSYFDKNDLKQQNTTLIIWGNEIDVEVSINNTVKSISKKIDFMEFVEEESVNMVDATTDELMTIVQQIVTKLVFKLPQFPSIMGSISEISDLLEMSGVLF